MAAPGGGQQPNQSDNSLGFLWILIGLTTLALFLWYFLSAQIITGVLYIRLYELKFVSLFTGSSGSVGEVITWIQTQSPANLSFKQLLTLSSIVGEYLRYGIAPILGIAAVILFFRHNGNRFKTIFNADKFVKTEASNWPQIAPIADLDLVKIHVDKGEWAMAMTPMMFAKKYDLLIVEKEEPDENKLATDMKATIKVDRGLTNAVFSTQVGKPWKTPNDLSIHRRALFAIFATRAAGEIDKARAILNQISASANHGGKLNFKGIDELFHKYKKHKRVKKVTGKHAFVLTIMASLLEMAREDGVLSSSEFLWLKPIDRELWYMLNTVGRQTSVSEVSGAYAHWLAEKRINRRINVPMIAEATDALNEAVQEFIYHDEQEV